jgi:hypothetical protein
MGGGAGIFLIGNHSLGGGSEGDGIPKRSGVLGVKKYRFTLGTLWSFGEACLSGAKPSPTCP